MTFFKIPIALFEIHNFLNLLVSLVFSCPLLDNLGTVHIWYSSKGNVTSARDFSQVTILMFSIINYVHSKHVSTQFTYATQMLWLSVASRKRVVILICQGYSLWVIRQRLLEEGNM